MKTLKIISVMLLLTLLGKAQTIYVNKRPLNDTIQSIRIFTTISQTSTFTAQIDTGELILGRNSWITDKAGKKIKYHSLLQLMHQIESNGYTLESKDFGLYMTIMAYNLFYVKSKNQ